jgi:hypothetical protein
VVVGSAFAFHAKQPRKRVSCKQRPSNREELHEREGDRFLDRDLFVILAIVAFLVGGETPGTDDPAREIVDAGVLLGDG